jgi:hypothetical protein
MVEHSDGCHLWFSEALVNFELLKAWHAFVEKKQKVDAAAEAEAKKKYESVSEAPVYLRFGLTKAHQGAIENDSYVQQMKARGVTEGPTLYGTYPPRASKNGHSVPYLASLMQGLEINHREAMTATALEPPLIVRQQIILGLQMAFDALPEGEKPENKAKLGLRDEFGQHKCNLDNSSHNWRVQHAYERLYLKSTPEMSQRAKKATASGDARKSGERYEDEVTPPLSNYSLRPVIRLLTRAIVRVVSVRRSRGASPSSVFP